MKLFKKQPNYLASKNDDAHIMIKKFFTND